MEVSKNYELAQAEVCVNLTYLGVLLRPSCAGPPQEYKISKAHKADEGRRLPAPSFLMRALSNSAKFAPNSDLGDKHTASLRLSPSTTLSELQLCRNESPRGSRTFRKKQQLQLTTAVRRKPLRSTKGVRKPWSPRIASPVTRPLPWRPLSSETLVTKT